MRVAEKTGDWRTALVLLETMCNLAKRSADGEATNIWRKLWELIGYNMYIYNTHVYTSIYIYINTHISNFLFDMDY